VEITFSIFPKFFKHLDVKGLAAMVREVGLDTTNLVIRDGYWVTPGGLAKEAPAFVRAMAEEGLSVRFATAGFSAEEVVRDPAPVQVLADAGITEFRMGYFRPGKDVRDLGAAVEEARGQLEAMCPVLERIGIRAVYQVHHGTLVPGPSGIYHLVKGLPSAQVGVMLDPGNQCYEGFEQWDRSARLLGDHLVAFGVKDTAVRRYDSAACGPDKGWRREWAPCDEGVTNWYDVVRAIRGIDFRGTFVWQPFYNEKEPDVMREKLAREVAYVRRVVAAVEAEG